MNAVQQSVERVDAFQQRRTPLAFAVGVVKKYGDDRGGQLAVLITYYGFLSLLPLMLLLSTVLGYVLHSHPSVQHDVLNSALADFPIIGDQIRENIHSLQGSALAVVIGALGLLYGAQGIAQTLQHTTAEVWNVPEVDRPGYLPRLVRGLLLFVGIGLGLVVSTGLASLVNAVAAGVWARIGAVALSLLVNMGLYLLAFRILTPGHVSWRQLLPGCLLGGPVWTALQTFGGLLVAHQLRHATAVYGFFATVIGLMSWLYLAAQLFVYAAEVNVVHSRRLWPRSLRQPPRTGADQRVLRDLGEQEQRQQDQRIDVTFGHDADEPRGGDDGGATAEPPSLRKRRPETDG